MDATLPDLAAGFMEMGAAGANRWLTPILAALRVRDGEEASWSFAAHPCRSEIVPEPGEAAGIFDSVAPYVSLAAVVGGEGRMIRLGVRDFFRSEGAVSDLGSDVRVRCAERPVRRLDPLAVADAIRGGDLRMTDVFCRFDYAVSRFACTIVAPCRYLNVLDGPGGRSPYAQPICGPVLSFDGDAVAPAWVAAQARADPAGPAPEGRVALARAMAVDATLLLRRGDARGLPDGAGIEPFLIDEFCFNRTYPGTLGLFVYA